MAVVGHAYVVVHAITDSVPGEIIDAFSGTKIRRAAEKAGEDLGNPIMRGISRSMNRKGQDNPFTRFSRNFNDLYPEAEGLRRTFVRLNRVGMVLQSGLGALAGSLGAVVGAAGALLGPLAGLVSSFGALGSAAITAKVGLSVAQYALNGISGAVKNATKETSGYGMSVEELREALQQLKFDQEEAEISVDRAALNMEKAYKTMLRTQDLAPSSLLRRDAEIAFREAELAYRKAKDREADLANGVVDPGGGGAATDPFADLTPSQRAFAEYLVSINDIFKDLRESAANGFLPLLQSQIERVLNSGLLDTLETRFFQIGQGAGLAVTRFVDVAMANNNMANFNIVLGQIATNLPKFGTIFGNVFDSLLSLMTALDPLTRRFLEFLERKTGAFARFLDVKNATGDLEGFFNRAGDIAGKFGTFFGGVFEGFGKIIQVNFGPNSPGDKLLQWLADVGEGFANKDLIGLDKYFEGAVDNFIIMAQTLGGAIETIVRAGSDPAVREFWETLDRGSFAFDKLVQNFVESGPGFANLLRSLTEVLAVLSDAGPVRAFTDTLAAAFDGLARFLRSIEPLLVVLGPIFGFISATALVISLVTKATIVLGSFGVTIASAMGFMKGLTAAEFKNIATKKGLAAATTKATGAMVAFNASNPIGWIMLATTAIAGLVIAMNGLNAANADKAVAGVTKAINTGSGSILEASKDAQHGLDRWMNEAYSVNELVSDIAEAQEWGFLGATMAGTSFAKSLDAIGTALANITVTDLPKSQAAFRKLRFEMKDLSDKEMFTVINEMDDFKQSLIDQADQLEINIRATDGTIDMQKLLNFAMGDGEYLLRQNEAALEAVAEAEKIVAEEAKRLFDEQVRLNAEFAKQGIDAGGWRRAVSDAYKGVQDLAEETTLTQEELNKKLLADTITNLEKAFDASEKFQDDLTKIRLKTYTDEEGQVQRISEASLQILREAGDEAPLLAEALVNATEEEFQRFDEIAKQAALKLSTPFQEAQQKIIDLWASGSLEQEAFDSLYSGLQAATNPEELQKILDDIAAKEFEIQVTANTEKADRAFAEFKARWGNNMAGAIKQNDRTSRPMFAYGGFVSGPGGPRSDAIPAMLSNGEYVVNARSTSRYRSLLERINSEGNRYADGGMVGGTSGINITVNPSPGMNEKDLAAAVSRRLAFEIRKGTI